MPYGHARPCPTTGEVRAEHRRHASLSGHASVTESRHSFWPNSVTRTSGFLVLPQVIERNSRVSRGTREKTRGKFREYRSRPLSPARFRRGPRVLTPHKKYTVPAQNPRTPPVGARDGASIMT
ncbi:hypothetical protein GCM10022232_43400 [Streptomyces plumbiresistens]|uniref:Uncharacterized protein n=1 Tax=Streptomyces plumbiresistens TaxID=511811 RepID=A0ABP7RPR6_9ACTN